MNDDLYNKKLSYALDRLASLYGDGHKLLRDDPEALVERVVKNLRQGELVIAWACGPLKFAELVPHLPWHDSYGEGVRATQYMLRRRLRSES
jgi:hypothetical protein